MKLIDFKLSKVFFWGTFGVLFCVAVFPIGASYCDDCQLSGNQCTVSGRVFDENGNIAKAVVVRAVRVEGPPRARSPYGVTDEKGNFSISNVDCGTNSVYAVRKSDSPFLSAFDDVKAVTVDVAEDHPTEGIELRLAPESLKLGGKVFDARTRKPLRDARVTITQAGKPDVFWSSSVSANGTFWVSIPSGAFSIKVSSPNHRTWQRRLAGKSNGGEPDLLIYLNN